MHLFEKPGPKNTEKVIELAVKRAKELGIEHVVVASTTGRTAEQLIGHGLNIVCVSYHVGFREPGKDELTPEMRQKLKDQGVEVLTTTHLMAGLDRAVRFKFGGLYPSEIIANTLRILGQGLKVCVEISGMALDAGLVPYGQEIIAIGGSGKGADTAVVIEPAHSNKFFDTRVKEIICMPREK
ncbi:MAG: hypothetical protein H0Z35_09725 [Thermoanaerobacteraceae bacterium]|nr:hypothetical protein [Thermoanaerobacteraceae bacterium]